MRRIGHVVLLMLACFGVATIALCLANWITYDKLPPRAESQLEAVAKLQSGANSLHALGFRNIVISNSGGVSYEDDSGTFTHTSMKLGSIELGSTKIIQIQPSNVR